MFFDDVTIDIIALLEILDAGFAIKDCDYNTYRNITELLAQSYTDEIFGKVLTAIRYKYSTVAKLKNLLNEMKIQNNVEVLFDN